MIWFVIISLLISIANVNALVPTGAGLDGLRDWRRSRPYVNLVRQVRQWGSPSAPYDNITSVSRQMRKIIIKVDILDNLFYILKTKYH